MKKHILFLAFIFGISFGINAQFNPHAIGIRLGGGNKVSNSEFSYQHGLGAANRVEVDLGFGSGSRVSAMYIAGIYHWGWKIDKGLNWFVGPGADIGFYSYNDNSNNSDYLGVGIGGQIGIEYDFGVHDVPILVGLDARPMWNFVGHDNGFGAGAALSIRYAW